MNTRHQSLTGLLAVAAVLVLGACGDDPQPTNNIETQLPFKLVVEEPNLASASVAVGDSIIVRASVVDTTDNVPISNADVFSGRIGVSVDPADAAEETFGDADAFIKGDKAGTATVTLSFHDINRDTVLTQSFPITVRP